MYFETSSLENVRVTEVFEETAKQIKENLWPAVSANNNGVSDSSHKVKLDINSFTCTPSNTDNFKL